MALIKSVVFCLFFLPFFGCQKQQEQPEIHQIRFGDVVGIYGGEEKREEYIFRHYMILDLNSDSALLKKNKIDIMQGVKENHPPEYYSGKIPTKLKSDLKEFQEYVLLKKSGAKFKIRDSLTTVFYSGPVTFLEYRKDTVVRYFFQKHIKSAPLYDPELGSISEKLFDLAVNPQTLKLSNKDFKLSDDSLIAPFAKRPELAEVVIPPPPPPVQKTIKFTPPVIKKKK